jgi:hypothetical protein
LLFSSWSKVSNDCEPLALKKFQNFKEYLSLYPEFSCIFVGDNGQVSLPTCLSVNTNGVVQS